MIRVEVQTVQTAILDNLKENKNLTQSNHEGKQLSCFMIKSQQKNKLQINYKVLYYNVQLLLILPVPLTLSSKLKGMWGMPEAESLQDSVCSEYHNN